MKRHLTPARLLLLGAIVILLTIFGFHRTAFSPAIPELKQGNVDGQSAATGSAPLK